MPKKETRIFAKKIFLIKIGPNTKTNKNNIKDFFVKRFIFASKNFYKLE